VHPVLVIVIEAFLVGFFVLGYVLYKRRLRQRTRDR